MKPILYILLLLTGSALGQNAAVTKNTATGKINGDIKLDSGNWLTLEGPIMAASESTKYFGTQEPLVWKNTAGHFNILTVGPSHGLISQSSGEGAIAIVGKTDNGSAAGKFVQQYVNEFAASVLYVSRDPQAFVVDGGSPPMTPALHVEGGSAAAGDVDTLIASFTGGGLQRLRIYNDGFIAASEHQMDRYPYHANPYAVMTYQWTRDEFKNETAFMALSAAQGNLTSGALRNLPSYISLDGPGEWSVWGTVEVVAPSAVTVSRVEFGVSNDAGLFDSAFDTSSHVASWSNNTFRQDTIRRRVTVSPQMGYADYFLNVRVTYTGTGNVTARGRMYGERLNAPAPALPE